MNALVGLWTVVGFAAMFMDMRMMDGGSLRLRDMFRCTGAYAVITATALIAVSI